MTRIALSLSVGLGLLLGGNAAFAQEGHGDHDGHDKHAAHGQGKVDDQKTGEQGEEAVLCPVDGQPVAMKQHVEYRGKPVFFCCEKCKAAFEKDPSEHAEGVKKQWAANKPLAIQVKCPGTGEPVNRKVYVDTDHGPVYFCCENCKAGWEKDSSAMEKKLADCYTFQTECPQMGGTIDPSVSLEVDGRTIYFCCPSCKDPFLKDKAANLKKVDEQIARNKAKMQKRHEQMTPEMGEKKEG